MGRETGTREPCLLSSAINYARREWERDIPNPVSGRKLKEPEGRVRWISRAEAVALLASATREGQAGHLPDFIRLALHTGCRKNKLLKLEWRRGDLHAGLFHLEARHTKTARRRSVPLNAEARAALMNRARIRATYCPDSPWVFTHEDGSRLLDVKKSFRTACRRAGIADFRIHDLRHTCAAWLVSAGVPLMSVRDLLGHASIKMTERYAHLAPDNVRLAVRQHEGEDEKSHFGHTGSPKDQGAVGGSAHLFDYWEFIGGAEEDRTPDLRIANATLSQLSYRPMSLICGWLNSAPNRAHILTSAWDNRYPDQRPSRGFLLSSSRSSSRKNFCRCWR